MRILIVVPHYYGPSHPGNTSLTIGSYIEPLGRIAALNELIVALHRHFARRSHTSNGTPILPRTDFDLDIVIVTKRGQNVLDELGVDPESFSVEYADCAPPWLAFQAQRIFRERSGSYDFYCLMEDDLSVHDPAFFDKLTWFQHNFGHRALLNPVRYEIPKTGSPVKCMVDPDLPKVIREPFLRPGQRQQLEGVWNGRQQTFSLPMNPHAASFFLTKEQLAYWMEQSTFNDGNDSWIGPLESAATFSIGRVFDIYKPRRPDPFFLSVEHFGTRYAAGHQPDGARYGESPMLAIAQNAIQMAQQASVENSDGNNTSDEPISLSQLVRRSLSAGTVTEIRGHVDKLERELEARERTISGLNKRLEHARARADSLRRQAAAWRGEAQSMRWLLRALRDELLRRWRR